MGMCSTKVHRPNVCSAWTVFFIQHWDLSLAAVVSPTIVNCTWTHTCLLWVLTDMRIGWSLFIRVRVFIRVRTSALQPPLRGILYRLNWNTLNWFHLEPSNLFWGKDGVRPLNSACLLYLKIFVVVSQRPHSKILLHLQICMFYLILSPQCNCFYDMCCWPLGQVTFVKEILISMGFLSG